VKRTLDFAFALLGLVLLAPVLLVIALAVWWNDFRSPFFLGRRAGRGGAEFRMVKFRTMTPDAWRSGVSSTAAGDARITSVGRWLRRWKLDELPQLVNVLKGEMSLVGPRPQVAAEVALYTREERQMLDVRPGITDPASIVFADESSILEGSDDPDLLYNQIIRPWKSRLALLYVEHRSSLSDVFILVLTFLAMISRSRALAGVEMLLGRWGADETLRRVARRVEPLAAHPPPGARDVVANRIPEVQFEQLLSRAPVRLQEGEIRANLNGGVVLVTGAGGSIGSELCRQIARYHPAALIGFDHAETALYEIDMEMTREFPDVAFYPELGSIQNRRRLEEVFEDYRPQSVFHAAAYKHVPLMESHLFEAVENNVFGTRNVAQAAIKAGVDEFVLVSSDKAVRPSNVMGATKRLAELVCLAAGAPGGRTRFMAVRFGNVLGSNGSVIPLFQRQITAGGPVTVTHPEMRRYFMTVQEAAQLMLQAAAIGAGGEIFVLDMGPPVNIVDLAHKLMRLRGLRPGEDIQIEFSGIRPGEKLFEELNALGENTLPTGHTRIRMVVGRGVGRDALGRGLEELRRSVEAGDAEAVLQCLKEVVPDYTPSRFVLDRTVKEKTRSVVA
jgi:lipopolysaccharide/colanic/teichoic acid biosynthesis glycosyltransferase/nucleoside-diphosphate-sugar epimerase